MWETPAVFKIPESVVYDPQREILYVSSFNRVSSATKDQGFISKMTLDGEVRQLEWITGLDGPCGMAVHGDRLYATEGVRGTLVEIDIETGEVLKRYPMPKCKFFNDISVDKDGTIYGSNSSERPAATDLYRFRSGQGEIWQDGDRICRANGVFLHGRNLLVASNGDRSLKSVNVMDGQVNTIAHLAGGLLDGIRVDNRGNYLVSHWEGALFCVSPAGDVVELLDHGADGSYNADFEYVKERNLLLVPTFFGNSVVAYTLTEE